MRGIVSIRAITAVFFGKALTAPSIGVSIEPGQESETGHDGEDFAQT
jgi:hypothetical protein